MALPDGQFGSKRAQFQGVMSQKWPSTSQFMRFLSVCLVLKLMTDLEHKNLQNNDLAPNRRISGQGKKEECGS